MAMHMHWSQLLFLHWPVPASALRALIPAELEIDTYDNDAWIGVVPFLMSGVRMRGCPRLPTAHQFPELNVRTYVRYRGRRGVWFFSLDAASKLSVRGARAWFGLPYFDAKMSMERNEQGVRYASERIHRGAKKAEFRAQYAPTGASALSKPGSLERFLTSRYTLFALRRGTLVYGEIDHASWPLQPATCALELCTMLDPLGIELHGTPHVLWASHLAVEAWSPRRAQELGPTPES